MQIKVQGHGVEVTEPLRDYAHKKVSKFEEFFNGKKETYYERTT